MLYFRCPSCQSLLADKQVPYEKECAKLHAEIEKEKNKVYNELYSTENIDKIYEFENKIASLESQFDERHKKIIDDLGVKRLCCRSRLISYTPLIKIIK